MKKNSNAVFAPKLKIISDNHSFKEQIFKMIEDCNITVDQIDADVRIDEKEPLIIITDDPSIPEYEMICAQKDGGSPVNTHIIFILPDCSGIIKHKNIMAYNSAGLHKSSLSKEIKDRSTLLISEMLPDNCLKDARRELKEANRQIKDYKKAFDNVKLIQKSVMIPPEDMDGFETYTVYEPFLDASGDVLLVKQIFNRVFIMIADVTDHGYAAAVYGSALYALANNYVQKAGIMEQDAGMWGHYMMKAAGMFYPEGKKYTKEQRKEQRETKKLLTANATFAVIDKMNQKIDVCFYGSGMEPPILVNNNTVNSILPIHMPGEEEDGEYEREYSSGIGVPLNDGECTAKVYSGKFYPGDMAVFYTDGATEIFSDKNKGKDIKNIYSSAKIISSVKGTIEKNSKYGTTTPEDIVNSILRDANAYSISTDIFSDDARNNNIPNISDDLTIFCIKWRSNR